MLASPRGCSPREARPAARSCYACARRSHRTSSQKCGPHDHRVCDQIARAPGCRRRRDPGGALCQHRVDRPWRRLGPTASSNRAGDRELSTEAATSDEVCLGGRPRSASRGAKTARGRARYKPGRPRRLGRPRHRPVVEGRQASGSDLEASARLRDVSACQHVVETGRQHEVDRPSSTGRAVPALGGEQTRIRWHGLTPDDGRHPTQSDGRPPAPRWDGSVHACALSVPWRE